MSVGDSSLVEQYQRLYSIAVGGLAAGGDASALSAPPGLRRVRDLHFFQLIGDLSLVIACDSNASIGEKPNDGLTKPYAEVGISVLKVPLMEVLATGARPILIVNALCMEMDSSGQKLITTMQDELIRSGLDPNIMLTGSTEDNVLTLQSGIGVTIIGIVSAERVRVGRTRPGDEILCVGNPKGGVTLTYSEFDSDIASIRTVQSLVELDEVHELLPVGSKGVVYEAQELAVGVSSTFRLVEPPPPINLYGSAGASTAVLVSVKAGAVEKIAAAVSVPVFHVGTVL